VRFALAYRTVALLSLYAIWAGLYSIKKTCSGRHDFARLWAFVDLMFCGTSSMLYAC
jgi:predicted transporter